MWGLLGSLPAAFRTLVDLTARPGPLRRGGVGGMAPNNVSVLSSREEQGELRAPPVLDAFEGEESPCDDRDRVTGPGDMTCS